MHDRINFGFGPELPMILQAETSECGLACLAMISTFYKRHTSLARIRSEHSVSSSGLTMAGLMRVATEMELSTRALKLELHDINKLRLPCILHWNFDHFVVLKKVRRGSVVIHDPAQGKRTLAYDELSASFTGVALELWPSVKFSTRRKEQSFSISDMFGKISGISAPCLQIMLLALVLEVMALLSPFYMQKVIDDVIVSADKNLLLTLAVGFLILMCLQQLVWGLRSWIIIYVSTSFKVQWQNNIFSHTVQLPVQYFEKRHLADVASRFSSTEHIQRTVTTAFLEAILDGVMSAATLTLMLIYDETLAFYTIAAVLFYIACRVAWHEPLRSANEEHIVNAARVQSHFLETVRGIKTLKLFQGQATRQANWLSLLIDQINSDVRVQRIQIIFRLLNGVSYGATNILIIYVGATLVMDETLTVGVFVAFMSYKAIFETRVSNLVDKLFDLRMLRVHAERLSDILLTEPEPHVLPTRSNLRENYGIAIEVSCLSYRYAMDEPYVLQEVNFQIRQGESVAVIGPSGCGKTTLVNVLLGILTPTSGDIYIDGTPIREMGFTALRERIGTVLQDDVLFAGSIADNICFFHSEPNFDSITRCAELSMIASDIEKMPMGYNTLVGDMGSTLSGGQRQRILLARALYKNPKILILDEATSHLDVLKETSVCNAIKGLQITRLIVAHRPETIASADRVIVMGSHSVPQVMQ